MRPTAVALAGLLLLTGAALAQELQDVVYLKDGSIIRGVIVEQVPGEYLKIETSDGSLFVYRLDQVERMTREPAKGVRSEPAPARTPSVQALRQIPSRKEPALAFLLSFLIVGGGQFYNGDTTKGIVHLGIAVLALSSWVMAIEDNSYYSDPDGDDGFGALMLLIGMGNYVYSMIEAPIRASRINEQRERMLLELGISQPTSLVPEATPPSARRPYLPLVWSRF
ncbi:MAG: hypothetical protein KatS3mg115_2121 [Candidatus Poribacteria bacterium]|nr:MAG: hypothetical protein KatS3mg115_2121 [Candidatus Poribacteria bacterium]